MDVVRERDPPCDNPQTPHRTLPSPSRHPRPCPNRPKRPRPRPTFLCSPSNPLPTATHKPSYTATGRKLRKPGVGAGCKIRKGRKIRIWDRREEGGEVRGDGSERSLGRKGIPGGLYIVFNRSYEMKVIMVSSTSSSTKCKVVVLRANWKESGTNWDIPELHDERARPTSEGSTLIR